jgi:hypothetical protein
MIAIDADGDGAHTISDLGPWLEYIFFAPGDALVWLAAKIPAVSTYLQLSPDWYFSWTSGIASFAVWFVILWSLDQFPRSSGTNEPAGPA